MDVLSVGSFALWVLDRFEYGGGRWDSPPLMRLLQIEGFSLVESFGNDIPQYAILSHTWGANHEEVTFGTWQKVQARARPVIANLSSAEIKLQETTSNTSG